MLSHMKEKRPKLAHAVTQITPSSKKGSVGPVFKIIMPVSATWSTKMISNTIVGLYGSSTLLYAVYKKRRGLLCNVSAFNVEAKPTVAYV